MKIVLFLLTLGLLACHSSMADNETDIKAVNKKVIQIEKAKQNFNTLEIKVEVGELEVVPPHIKYYYKPENSDLVMLNVTTGHEIFLTKFTYYFENNRIIKFIKDTEGHPDAPPKQAIIYKADGSVLWNNID